MSEEELIYNYRLGNKEALSFLFSLYEKKVIPLYYKYENIFKAAGYEREDIKIFVKECVVKAINGYRFKNKKFNTYYSSVAYRMVVSLYRDIEGTYDEKTYNNSISLSDYCIEEKMYIDDRTNKQIELNFVLEAIKEIGEKEYKIIIYYLEGHTHQEIAEKMSLNEKSVSNYVQKIREKLKKLGIK